MQSMKRKAKNAKLENYQLPASPAGGPTSKSQSGVTLIIALVMLASVTFISFSISTIIIREIGSARLVLKTEPAISGANAGGEVGLYQLLRQTGQITSGDTLSTSGAQFQVTTKLYDNPYPFSIPAGSTLSVALYDATNFNNPAADYGSVTITNNEAGSNPIKVQIYSFGDLVNPVCEYNLGLGQNSVPPCQLTSADDRYRIVITPNGGQNAAGQITTTDNNGAPKGVPSNNPSISVTGLNGEVQRKIQINLTGP